VPGSTNRKDGVAGWPVELVALTQVGGDRDRVAGAGVGPGQGPPTDPGVEVEPHRCHRLDVGGAFHAPQLAPVVVAVGLQPLGPVQAVAGRLHHPLPVYHPLAVLLIAALGRGPSRTEAGASLTCKNSGSPRSRPWSRPMNARVPTLPTPPPCGPCRPAGT